MEKLKWFFKGGKCYEEYTVLYSKGDYILVQSDKEKHISFGMRRDFGTLCGFPVNQSCLTIDEAKELLTEFIKIANKYPDVRAGEKKHLGYTKIDIYNGMIDALNKITKVETKKSENLINTIEEDCRLWEKIVNKDSMICNHMYLKECDDSKQSRCYELIFNDIVLWWGTLNEINAVVKSMIHRELNISFGKSVDVSQYGLK